VAQQQPTKEYCQEVGNIVREVVNVRDNNVHPQTTMMVLVQNGIPFDVARSMVIIAYGQPNKDLETIYAEFMNNCLGQAM